MAKTPLKKAIGRIIRNKLENAVRDGRPKNEAIKVAARSAAKWLDNHVLRFKQNTPQGIALELGTDFIVYEIVEPSFVKIAEEIADDIAKGDEGKLWRGVETAVRKRKAKRAAKQAE